jgi:cystathionine beta-lyase/cystathionine gamma-synthase
MIPPDDAYRRQTRIQTFTRRFQRQCRNAAKLASFLEKSEKVKRIWYPGLEKHTTYDVAKKLFGQRGYGAMITFDLDGKNTEDRRKKRDNFISKVSGKIKLIPSLGDSRTILMPVEAVWGAKYPEPGMIRLSVGFEEYGEIEEVIMKAIDSI